MGSLLNKILLLLLCTLSLSCFSEELTCPAKEAPNEYLMKHMVDRGVNSNEIIFENLPRGYTTHMTGNEKYFFSGPWWLQIVKELPLSPTHSWFLVRLKWTDLIFEMEGPSIHCPLMLISPSDEVCRIHHLTTENNGEGNHLIKFYIKNFQVSMNVDPSKHPGYCNRMPLLLIDAQKSLEDEFGYYFYNVIFKNPLSEEVISLRSQDFNERLTVSKIKLLNYAPPEGDRSDSHTFTMEMTLNDGTKYVQPYSLIPSQQFLTGYTHLFWTLDRFYDYVNQDLQIGGEVIFIKESFLGDGTSQFIIKFLRNQLELPFNGMSRKWPLSNPK